MQPRKLNPEHDSRVFCIYGNETDRIRRTASMTRQQQQQQQDQEAQSGGGALEMSGSDANLADAAALQREGSMSGSSGNATSTAASNARRPGSARRLLMRQLVKEAVGHIAIDRRRENLYYTAEGCVRVRRVVAVDGLVESGVDNVAEFYNETVRPLVHGVFEKDRDVVVIVGGDSGTSKTQIIHGSTLEESDADVDVPPRGHWGVAYHVVDEVLKLSKVYPCETTVTACRLHHDHIADALVSSSGVRMTKNNAKKNRQQYSRLLAISSTSALELEELEGRFAVQDQIDCAIHDIADFTHVANCFAALNSGRVYLKLGQRKASPFHYVISVRMWRVGHDEPRYIHLVETADFDYESSVPEETEAFRRTVSLIPDIAAAITSRNVVRLKSLVRESTLTRVCMGNIDLDRTDFVVVAMSKFSHAMQTMEYLARCKQVSIRIVLHGPDGEGEGDVDPELKQHVLEIQQRCEELAKDVAYLQDERSQMLERIAEGRGVITRLEQQQSVVKSLASSNVLKRREGKHEVADDSAQRAAQSAAERNRLRLQALERDLRVMKDEDQRRAEATEQQIRFMNAERARCAERTAVLQKELDALKQKLDAHEAAFAKDKAALQAEMQAKINEAIERSRQELDGFNAARRAATEASLTMSMEREEQEAARERAFSDGLKSYADSLTDAINGENQKWAREHEQLEQRLADLQRQRMQLEAEKIAVDAAFEREMQGVDIQTAALSDYANVLSKTIWRLEGHNSTEARRIINYPKCGVQIFDPTMKHGADWFEKRCRAMRKWLDERGYPRPAVFYDVHTGVVRVLDLEMAKLRERPVVASAVAQTDPIPIVKAAKDYSGVLAENLAAAEHSLRIVTASQQRLQRLHETKSNNMSSASVRSSSTRPGSSASNGAGTASRSGGVARPQSAAFRKPLPGAGS